MTVQKATLKPYLEEIRQWVAARAHRHLDRPCAQLDAGFDLGVPIGQRHSPPRVGLRAVGSGACRRRSRHPTRRPRRRRSSRAGDHARRRLRADAAVGGSRSGSRAANHAARRPGCRGGESRGRPTPAPAKRRRRGGRGRNKKPQPGFEATLDTGDEGYGFWLDGAVKDDPVFAEHWAGRRGLIVRIEADQIVIRPTSANNGAWHRYSPPTRVVVDGAPRA